jgi:hypothetical protein
MSDAYGQARAIATILLKAEADPDGEGVRTAATRAAAIVPVRDGEVIDIDRLVVELETWLRVSVSGGGFLDDPTGHEPWLQARRSDLTWNFWERYRRYLEDELALPRHAVARTHELTDEILSRLENPKRAGKWDRRGLVAGQVQSGKTGNYIGLICKAADAGYKLIVIMAGVHNSLRSQTQLRVDQGFIGFDSQRRRMNPGDDVKLGVGRLPGSAHLPVHTLTTSAELGDFNLAIARQANIDIGGSDPVVLVVKKNASVLKNLITWATLIHQRRAPGSERMVVGGVPMLLIDDEADHASINTADPDEFDPSMINRLIRQLLSKFEQTGYVGYTATPFASILIDHEARHSILDDDLFPRSFILTLRPPSNYVGPARVFGLSATDIDPEGEPPLPLVRSVGDSEPWLPTGHRKEAQPGALPESLRRAIRSFVLAAAARTARGEAQAHNSMLVHVTRYVAVQERVADLIADEVDRIRRRLRYGEGSASDQMLEELEMLWRRDFEPTSIALLAEGGVGAASAITAWEDVASQVAAAAGAIEVRRINGTAKEALDYFERRDGLSIIAVGGDKLSRGLTLEGLSISYFLRASQMYDTLLQMGRWFGYRPGYLDLCRLFITADLERWYTQITAASDELYRLFDHMVAAGGTPQDFGLRIRSSPDGLTVTAPAKMKRATTLKLSYSGTISETVSLFRDERRLAANQGAADALVASLGSSSDRRGEEGSIIWRRASPAAIVDFLESYQTHPAATKADGPHLARYVRERLVDDELTDWTVALISSRDTARSGPVLVGGLPVGPVRRSEVAPSTDRYSIRRLVSPTDETLDLSADKIAEALARTQATRDAMGDQGEGGKGQVKVPAGPAIREVRSPAQGLLLVYALMPDGATPALPLPAIGFAVSFPFSTRAKPIDYTVNVVYLQQEFGWE